MPDVTPEQRAEDEAREAISTLHESTGRHRCDIARDMPFPCDCDRDALLDVYRTKVAANAAAPLRARIEALEAALDGLLSPCGACDLGIIGASCVCTERRVAAMAALAQPPTEQEDSDGR